MKSTVSNKALRRMYLTGIISITDYCQIMKKRKEKPVKLWTRKPFILDDLDDTECHFMFRFSKEEIHKIHTVMNLPRICRTENKIRFTGIEGLCVVLRRLTYPNRLVELVGLFNRDAGSISRIFNWTINLIFRRHCWRLTTLDQPWIINNFDNYADCCVQTGSWLPNVIGFIDGTARPICRPKQGQQEVYSGYKKQHVLKYQSITLPNGLIARLDGAFIGRRHDAAILQLSDLIAELRNLLVCSDGSWYTLYGDPGYSNQKFIKVGYKNYSKLNPLQKLFNKEMSALRVSVEYGFGRIIQQFAFLDFKKNQKVLLQPLKKMYFVAALLANCQVCLRGSQVSKYFDCPPPTLDEYFEQ